MSIERYTIWLADFPFQETTESKTRPVLILNEKELVVFCMKITSQPRKIESDFVIENWELSGLIRPSVLKTSERIHLKKTKLIREIGNLHTQDLTRLKFKHILPR